MKLLILSAILALASVSLAGAQYSDPLDAWRACGKYGSEAAKGNPIALHTCFVAAYVRQNDPYLGGEDLEAIFNCMNQLLEKLGDKKFTEGLAMERPEIIAAVGQFLSAKRVGKTPKTDQLIQTAPKIDFPLSQSAQDTKTSPLLQRFKRYEAQHKSR